MSDATPIGFANRPIVLCWDLWVCPSENYSDVIPRNLAVWLKFGRWGILKSAEVNASEAVALSCRCNGAFLKSGALLKSLALASKSLEKLMCSSRYLSGNSSPWVCLSSPCFILTSDPYTKLAARRLAALSCSIFGISSSSPPRRASIARIGFA